MSKPRSRLWKGKFRAPLEREGDELKTHVACGKEGHTGNYAGMQICSMAIDGDTGNIM